MEGNKPLGYGLLAGAAGVTLLMGLWLVAAGVNAGGLVLGLLLLFVIAGPMAGGGWYVLSRQKSEALEEQRFVGKRRILEADRIFRRELASELRQLARRPALQSAHVDEMAEDLERRSYDSPEWYDTVALTDSDSTELRRYDDLVWSRVQSLRERADRGETAGLDREAQALQQSLDQRRDLLMRGKRAPMAAPSDLLRSEEPRRGTDALLGLAIGDAITADGEDYVVEGVATSFAEGQTWHLAHLVASGVSNESRWLYVAPGGLSVAVLQELKDVQPNSPSVSVDGMELRQSASGSATVDVTARGGSAQGVLVAYWRYLGDVSLALVELWPDGAVHTYGGAQVRADALDVWPASVRGNP
jgi:hypothetical protein